MRCRLVWEYETVDVPMANKLETGSIANAVMSRWYSKVFNVPTTQSSLSLNSSEKSLRPVRPKFLRENMMGVTSCLYVRAYVYWIRAWTDLSRSVERRRLFKYLKYRTGELRQEFLRIFSWGASFRMDIILKSSGILVMEHVRKV